MFQMALNWCVWGQLMSSGGLRLLSTFHSGRALTCCVQNPTSCNYSVVGVLWPWSRCAIVTRPSQQWLLVNHLSRDGYCHLLVTSSFDKKNPNNTHTSSLLPPSVKGSCWLLSSWQILTGDREKRRFSKESHTKDSKTNNTHTQRVKKKVPSKLNLFSALLKCSLWRDFVVSSTFLLSLHADFFFFALVMLLRND